MNKIRIRDVKMSEKSLSLVAELTAAYEPSVGVEKFERRFLFTAPAEFQIEDSIKATRPQVI